MAFNVICQLHAITAFWNWYIVTVEFNVLNQKCGCFSRFRYFSRFVADCCPQITHNIKKQKAALIIRQMGANANMLSEMQTHKVIVKYLFKLTLTPVHRKRSEKRSGNIAPERRSTSNERWLSKKMHEMPFFFLPFFPRPIQMKCIAFSLEFSVRLFIQPSKHKSFNEPFFI